MKDISRVGAIVIHDGPEGEVEVSVTEGGGVRLAIDLEGDRKNPPRGLYLAAYLTPEEALDIGTLLVACSQVVTEALAKARRKGLKKA